VNVRGELDPNKPTIQLITYKDLGSVIVSVECPTCQTQLPSDHPAFHREVLLEWVKTNGGWDRFESSMYVEGKVLNVPNLPDVKIAAIKQTYDPGDIDLDYYGELPQGTEFEVFVVLQVGENAFFKKTGTGDSYGRVSWDGEFKNVTPREKKVLVFE
jgi:hypothetical protein